MRCCLVCVLVLAFVCSCVSFNVCLCVFGCDSLCRVVSVLFDVLIVCACVCLHVSVCFVCDVLQFVVW